MTSESTIPVILIGCGAVSQQFYLPTLRTLSAAGELTVRALVDPSNSARAALASAFPQAAQAESATTVDAPPGSLAIIASPPRFHAAQTIEAVSRGWHVLCEKPMASTAAEAEQMIEAARAANRLLAIGQYKRFFPSSSYLKQLCTHQALGALRTYTIAEGGPFRWPAASPSFFNRAQTPGGVLLDIGVHVLDLLLWWLGEPASFTYADDAMGGLETNSRLVLSHAGGARGAIHLSRDWNTAQHYTFEFERGVVGWKVNDANGLTVQLRDMPASLRAQLAEPLSVDSADRAAAALATNAQSFIAQLRNVLAAVRGTAPLLVPGTEGIRALRFIERCYREKTLLTQPWLTAEEAAQAAKLVGNTAP